MLDDEYGCYEDGYYWAVNPADNTLFIVCLEDTDWFTIGLRDPMVNFAPETQVLCAVARPISEFNG
jgi:hypothetical protein